MQGLSRLLWTYRLLVSLCRSGTDYLLYVVEEFRNSDRHKGWTPGEMTVLLTAQEGTREEIELAHARRSFWNQLVGVESNSGS